MIKCLILLDDDSVSVDWNSGDLKEERERDLYTEDGEDKGNVGEDEGDNTEPDESARTEPVCSRKTGVCVLWCRISNFQRAKNSVMRARYPEFVCSCFTSLSGPLAMVISTLLLNM